MGEMRVGLGLQLMSLAKRSLNFPIFNYNKALSLLTFGLFYQSNSIQSLNTMGNAADVCRNPATDQLEIVAQTGQAFPPPKNKKPLQPILFDQQQGDSYTPIENEKIDIKIQQTPVKESFPQEKKYNTNKTSYQKLSKLNLDKMVIVNQSTLERPLHIKDDYLSVPFSVIKLSISQNLKKSIRQFGQQIFSKHEKQNAFNNWKLHKKGYYITHLGEKLYAVMTNVTYFQGELIEVNSQILPTEEGILFTEQGMYSGTFENGKANGKGYFRQLSTKATFKGTWKDGTMMEGTIQSQNFKFEGQFVNQLAHGKGRILFKESTITYNGYFEEGVYSDTKGFLQSKHYIYQGGFVDGKKQGIGCLVEKQLPQKDRKQKYRPPQQYQGKWHQDCFENPFLASSMKK